MKIGKNTKIKKIIPTPIVVVKKHYDYWDNFIKEWKIFSGTSPVPASFSGFPHLSDWTCPFGIKGSGKSSLDTIKYLPEPWWGNDGTHPLSVVVINLNPGPGGAAQLFSNPATGVYNINPYSNFITENVSKYSPAILQPTPTVSSTGLPILLGTSDWHYKNRAYPIFDALNILGINLSGKDYLQNILSLELVPWHTQGWGNLGSYPKTNTTAIFEHIIMFAAEASRCIDNEKLRKYVLVRSSLSNFKMIFNKTLGGKYQYKIDAALHHIIDSNLSLYRISNFEVVYFPNHGIDDVRFILVWQNRQKAYNPVSNNNFPHCSDLIRIIQDL